MTKATEKIPLVYASASKILPVEASKKVTSNTSATSCLISLKQNAHPPRLNLMSWLYAKSLTKSSTVSKMSKKPSHTSEKPNANFSNPFSERPATFW